MVNEQSDDDLIQEMLPAFIEEANEQSDALETLLLELESAPGDRDLLDALFRCAHTIKGSAGVFGLDDVVHFTHHVEALLQRLRDGLIQLSPALNTLLLRSNDTIRILVNAARHERALSEAQICDRDALIAQLVQITGHQHGPSSPDAHEHAQPMQADSSTKPWCVQVRFGADTFRHGIDPLSLLNYVRGLGQVSQIQAQIEEIPTIDALDPESCHWCFDFVLHTNASHHDIEQAFKFALEDCTLTISPLTVANQDDQRAAEMNTAESQLQENMQTPALQKQPKQRAGGVGGGDESAFIRVQADRLDEVINLLGELVIAGSGASMIARQARQRGLVEANQQVMRLIESIRNSTLKLRMVPIGDTFARFKRVVRDTATELGKDVALEIVGGDTELDKAMVERIADPLMHLVRNALDHGLETPEQRQAAGKPMQGKVTLSACHESSSVLIRIVDDGRGIQRDKVLARAWERGLLERGVTPPDDEILHLIFAPGFSTAETVTNLSGRGVGMDVVRSNVEALRGTVTVTSTPGEGSCMEIRLPLTLAIIDGFLVGVGASKFIVPLESVVEVIANREAATTVDSRGRCCVELRGQVLPVVNLRTLYALDSPQPERCSVVVVRSGNRRFGVLVDTLLGQHQTVIKPLGQMLRSLRGVSGSSILGSGEVALIFDAPALGQLAAQPRSESARTRLHSSVGDHYEQARQ
jgi:two-component system, chemotaxis family, sensor kinase CheA